LRRRGRSARLIFWFRLFRLRRLGFRLFLWSSVLVLRLGLGRLASKLETDEILADGDGILLVGEEFLYGTRSRSIDSYVDLEREKISYASSHRPLRWGRERLALSVSMVAISSSNSTKSPICFDHCFNVPSEIDSAISGTLTTWSAYERNCCTTGKGYRNCGALGARKKRDATRTRLESIAKCKMRRKRDAEQRNGVVGEGWEGSDAA
jgi:hypothetical protein